MTTHMKLALHELDDGRDIAIIEGTLPEVYDTDNPNGAEVSMGNPADGEYSVCVRERDNNTADWYYRAALCNLAMWQYKLGEGQRKEAAAIARSRRRDELAKEIARKSGWSHWEPTRYGDHQTETQEAIDMIIRMETP